MKRGVDENKQGPMFPRLHVNDTEKGGPRAPPRNKMALYEQLSIPSQRLSGGLLPVNPNSTAQQNPLTQKKQEDDDFRVPVFAQQSGTNLDHIRNHRNKDNEDLSSFNSLFSGRLANIQRNNSQDLSKSASNESVTVKGVGYGNSLLPIRDVQQEVVTSPVNGDDVSETSMVDSVSGADISPDEVVGVIGQKHFWKARRAIVNQQRLFAVQVFELHRLIKVQRLIAGLPQPIMAENAFLGKPSIVSPVKKIPIPINTTKVKDYNEKSKDDTREFSAEKASISSVQNSGGTGYPLPASDPRMGSWGMNMGHPTPPGHQWLIPVMSPSEGLIYKPYYPGPGYMSSGPGPPGSAQPMFGPGPPPSQPHYQWPAGFPGMVPPPAHGYFPPYGMTRMNTSSSEEIHPFNMPHQQHVLPPVANYHASNNGEVQVSTASSQSDRIENRDVLPLFPTRPPSEGGVEPGRAIRVVPRNARLATESVARIFQSIQDERKRQDPV